MRIERRKSSRFAPYGWQVHPLQPKRWIILDSEQEVVQLIGKLRPIMGYYKIAKELTSKGYKPRGKQWEVMTIKRICEQNNFNEGIE